MTSGPKDESSEVSGLRCGLSTQGITDAHDSGGLLHTCFLFCAPQAAGGGGPAPDAAEGGHYVAG